MGHHMLGVAVGAILLAIGARSHAQEPDARGSLLVSVEWLAEHLEDRNLVLLHVGEEEEYGVEHIAGAQYIQLRDISDGYGEDAPLALELLGPEALREALAGFGISDDSRIIVYHGSDWVTPTTRIMFTLHYAGLGERTSILDGGMPAWKAAGREVTAERPEVRAGRLSPLRTVSLVVGAEYVQEHKDAAGYALVDGRAAMFYDGVRETRSGTGHIPGAGSVPFTEIVAESLHFLSAAELRERFERAGVEPGDTVIAYCHIGQQATLVLFAARTLGYDYRLYDGSMEDWGNRGLPLAVPDR